MSRYRNLALFVLLAALWGSAFVAIKAGLEFFPPVLFAAVRYDLAAVLMLGYALWASDHPVPTGRGEWTLVILGGALLIAGYHAFLFVGETHPAVTSAAAAVIVSLSPVLTTGFARALLPGERLTLLGVVGLLFGLAGVAVLVQPNPADLLVEGAVAKLLVFAAAASFALGAVLTRRVEASLPVETMQAWAMLAGALLLHAVSLALGESVAAVTWSRDALLALGYLSVAASALGFLLYFDLLERLGPVEINLVSYVAPVFAALTGWALLGEETGASTAVGFALIFAGFLLVKRRAVGAELPRLREEARDLLRN